MFDLGRLPRNIPQTAGIAMLMLATTAGEQSGLPQNTWTISAAPPELRYYVSRADLVITSLHDTLRRELTGALRQGGPAFAINSCHIDVIGLTQRVAREEGLAAGRTSARLRNPTNIAPEWAAPLVRSSAGVQAREVEGFAVDLGDAVGVLRPIAQRPMCAACHGPVEQIQPAVRAVLKDRYPADRATGFKDGDLRGWFWVKVPKRGAHSPPVKLPQ